ncbi:hypothetical protein ACXY7D_18805 [Sphingomonas melonis]
MNKEELISKLDWAKREIASYEMFNPDKESNIFIKGIRYYLSDIIKVLEDDIVTSIAIDRYFEQ